jgi:MFS family permease
MVCSGSSELAMAQWASAFTESALGVSKVVGDLAGPCLFAVLMGISRSIYGAKSEKLDLTKTMLFCGLLCLGCYLLASLSSSPVWGLVGCAVCGFSVGIMWPGTLSISSQECPKGGTAMFALLALGGDLGGSAGPAVVGGISGVFGGDLKAGLLAAAVFPVLLILGLLILKRTACTGQKNVAGSGN